MRLTSSLRKMGLSAALSVLLISTSGMSGWCGQSKPAEKDSSGSQAGSSGKSPDQMGSRGSTESPVRTGDPDTKKKPKKKSRAKKTSSAKSGSTSGN